MLFDSWYALLRIACVGACAYVALIVLLRLSGKRTLSKLNAFDLVVTVALGSTLSSTLLDKNVTLVDGVTALALLVGLQLLVAWGTTRSKTFEGWVNAEPTLLLHRGRFLPAALRQQRVTEAEVRAAVRQARVASLEDVEAVVLEPSGELSVVLRAEASRTSALEGVDGAGEPITKPPP